VSEFCFNTNHVSVDLGELKPLIETKAFSGLRLQVVYDVGTVRHGSIARPRQMSMSMADLAKVPGVPVLDRLEPPENSDNGHA
jgi:hypothetical protein